MFARAISDINWSTESYSTSDLMSKYPAPLLVRVTQGHCGLEDTDSLGQGQVIRIHRWLRQTRVKAIDSRGRNLSIPLDFDIPFEIIPDRKRSLSKRKTMSLVDIPRQYSLPKKVRFSTSHLSESQALDGGRLGVRMTLEPLDLIELHQEVYLNGNAVNFGELDSSILSIPIHHDLEMSVALGLDSGDKNWRRLMRELDNVVAKRVRFAAAQGNQKITAYASKVDDENIQKSLKKTSVVQKRQQSLGRAFYYGTLQRTKAADKETKPRPSKSVDLGSLARNGQMEPDVRGTNRRFAKRKEARLTRGVDKVDTISVSGTSTSATSMSGSTTDTMDTNSETFWFNANTKNGIGDFDDDMSDITNDDDLDDSYMPPSLFGSVSRLSLFRPNLWSGRDMNGDVDGIHRQAKGWKAVKARHGLRRLSTATSLSMGDIGNICNGLGQRGDSLPSTLQRGLPDGRSMHSGIDGDDDDDDDYVEQSTNL